MTRLAIGFLVNLIQGNAGAGVIETFHLPPVGMAMGAIGVEFHDGAAFSVAITAIQIGVVALERPAGAVVGEDGLRIPAVAVFAAGFLMAKEAGFMQVDFGQIAHGVGFFPIDMAGGTALLLVTDITVALILGGMETMVEGNFVVFFIFGFKKLVV